MLRFDERLINESKEMTRREQALRTVQPWIFGLSWLLVAACQLSCKDSNSNSSVTTRDINAVLRDHDKKLMAIPGIVGIYVGLLPDGKTACLKVMAATNTAQIQRSVPKKLEGYPVVIEETGIIRPLPEQKANP